MNKNPDFFCYLPDNILILLLSFLPFKEAAKTCILSKRWRLICQKWLITTRAEFNENLFIEEINGEIKLSRQAFLDFTRRFVSHHQGRNLHEFHLKISNPNDHRSDVEGWIKFAIDKNVEVLDLDFSRHEASEDDGSSDLANFVLPQFLYEYISLKVLKLTSCDLKRLDFANFSALKGLYAARVELSSKSLKILVAGCPLLETLSLEKCSGLGYIEIASPGGKHLESLMINECKPLDEAVSICAHNLRSFKYFGVSTIFDLGDLGSLEHAQLDFGIERDFFELGDVLCELLRGLYNAKALSVCSYTIQVTPSGEEPLRLSTALNVRHLILNTGVHRDELPGIAFLLRSCPLLETLTIEMGNGVNLNGYIYPYQSSLDGKLFWASQMKSGFKCFRKNLKSIEMKNFRATENAIRLVEFLLFNSKALQKLTIITSKQMSLDRENSEDFTIISQKLRQFRRASPKVQVWIV